MSSAKKLKKGAEEADPEKRTYGPGMVQKILAFYTRYEAAQATVSQLMVRCLKYSIVYFELHEYI